MIPVTAAEMRHAVAGKLYGDENLTVSTLSTDSRQITPGDWFVPILGERFDGHDYIDKALEAGAVGCFCARLPLFHPPIRRSLPDLACRCPSPAARAAIPRRRSPLCASPSPIAAANHPRRSCTAHRI